MRPVRTEDCDVVYKSSQPEIHDLWCHRIRLGSIRTTWELEEDELEMVRQGGRIHLIILKEPIPPVALCVVSAEQSEPIAEHEFKINKEPGDDLTPPAPDIDEEEDEVIDQEMIVDLGSESENGNG